MFTVTVPAVEVTIFILTFNRTMSNEIEVEKLSRNLIFPKKMFRQKKSHSFCKSFEFLRTQSIKVTFDKEYSTQPPRVP